MLLRSQVLTFGLLFNDLVLPGTRFWITFQRSCKDLGALGEGRNIIRIDFAADPVASTPRILEILA